jgi:cellulose synthase/poly-beta-1,6-N-acetylglucosamine synthase-like glycosyltransferase
VSPPTVSVIMATYQGRLTVERSIRSLLAQTVAPLEVIVVDDGSTDGTGEVLARLACEAPTLRVVSSPQNRGVPASLNHAISLARGDYVAIADDDDECAPTRLDVSVSLLERTGADMAGGQVIGSLRWPLRFATSRFPIDPAATSQRVVDGADPLPHITMMVRRDGFERFGSYRSVPRAADLELMLRWAHRGAHLVVSPEVMAIYAFRWEFFRISTQTRWMIGTRYARTVALLDDDEVPSFDEWCARESIWPARREALRCVVRLTARLAFGTLDRRS